MDEYMPILPHASLGVSAFCPIRCLWPYHRGRERDWHRFSFSVVAYSAAQASLSNHALHPHAQRYAARYRHRDSNMAFSSERTSRPFSSPIDSSSRQALSPRWGLSGRFCRHYFAFPRAMEPRGRASSNRYAQFSRSASLYSRFFLVAFAEETMLRGALLFWLSRSIGFSSAALLSSIAFGLLHTGNGEPLLGAFSAGLIGLFFCLTLRATGSLWFAIGFHTAWDYGQSALLGCRDSGLASTGAWLNMVPHGPAWLSGSEAGPEGGVLCLAGIGLGCVALARRPSRMAINIGDEHTSHHDRTTDQRA